MYGGRTDPLEIIRVVDLIKAELRCGICYSTVKSPVVTTCNHLFCKDCFDECIKRLSMLICPMCKAHLRRRSCTKCDTYDSLVESYLQMARCFKRDLDAASFALQPTENFLESQAIVSSAVPSPLRSFTVEPKFAVPVLPSKKRAKSSAAFRLKKPKLETFVEEEENISFGEPSLPATPPTFQVKQPPADEEELPLRVFDIPTASVDTDVRPSSVEESVQTEGTSVVDKETQADTVVFNVSVGTNFNEMIGLIRERANGSTSEMAAVLELFPELRRILLENKEEVLHLLGEEEKVDNRDEVVEVIEEKVIGKEVIDDGVIDIFDDEPRDENEADKEANEVHEKGSVHVQDDQPEEPLSHEDADETIAYVDSEPRRKLDFTPIKTRPPPFNELVTGTPESLNPHVFDDEEEEKTGELREADETVPSTPSPQRNNDDLEILESDSFNDTLVINAKSEKSLSPRRRMPSQKENLQPEVVFDSFEDSLSQLATFKVAFTGIRGAQDEELLREFRSLFPHVELVEKAYRAATHVVVLNTVDRVVRDSSLQLAYAHALRLPVIARDWILACVRKKKLLDTSAYTVLSSTVGGRAAWEVARSADVPLFHDISFFAPVEFCQSIALPREKVIDLITHLGGNIVEKPWKLPKKTQSFILFASEGRAVDAARRFEGDCRVPVYTMDWLIDSICQYQIIQDDKYRVAPPR